MNAIVLVVDDEAVVRNSIAQWLELTGAVVRTAADVEQAVVAISNELPDVVLTDLKMPRKSGIDLMHDVHRVDPDIPVVLLTAHGDIPLAVASMREGAYDFLQKPYAPDHLSAVIARAIEKRGLTKELRRLSQRIAASEGIESRLLGTSPGVQRVRELATALSGHDCAVIITGQTGTGKEVVGRALHDFGHRAKGPFVAVNCAAIPAELSESELFGHEAGAFTGARGARAGKFEYAHSGTLLLDEIESMPLALQAKILRILQERVVERVGSNRLIPIDVRIVATSKLDLEAESRAGRFRADLYYRLMGAEISIPPLKDRGDDVLLLFEHFSQRAAAALGASPRTIRPSDVEALMAHDWPGNVRELKAVAERYALGLAATGRSIDEVLRRAASRPAGGSQTLAERVAAYERRLIEAALHDHHGSIAAVTRALGIPRRTLNEKMARHGLTRANHAPRSANQRHN